MACEHNVIPCNGGLRHWFRNGWVCVRCDQWFREHPPLGVFYKGRSVGPSTFLWR